MEALTDDIATGKSLELLKEYKARIMDTAKNIKSNDDTFNIKTLPAVSDKLSELMTSYTEIFRQVDASERAFNALKKDMNPKQEFDLNTFQDYFTQQYDSLLAISNLEEDALPELQALILPPPPTDEEIVVEAPRERRWPKDPITQTNIKKAVRNTVCNHIYDRSSIENYIEQRKTNKLRAPCPVAGCRNKNTTKKDLVPDDESNKLIESLRDLAM